MILPNLLVVGAMKAGTTALHDQLAQHPAVYMSAVKETDHFLRPDAAERLDEYAAHFASAGEALVVGESSPNYTKREAFEGVPERIAAALPDPRFVYLVRDPIERIRSHYQHHLAQRGRWMSFADAALYEGFVAPTRYGHQIRPYLDAFGPERVLIMTSEHLRDQPAAAMEAVWEFLGIVPHPVVSARSHMTSAKRMPRSGLPPVVRRILPDSLASRRVDTAEPLPDRTRAALLELLEGDIRELRHLDVVGFDGWGLFD